MYYFDYLMFVRPWWEILVNVFMVFYCWWRYNYYRWSILHQKDRYFHLLLINYSFNFGKCKLFHFYGKFAMILSLLLVSILSFFYSYKINWKWVDNLWRRIMRMKRSLQTWNWLICWEIDWSDNNVPFFLWFRQDRAPTSITLFQRTSALLLECSRLCLNNC